MPPLQDSVLNDHYAIVAFLGERVDNLQAIDSLPAIKSNSGIADIPAQELTVSVTRGTANYRTAINRWTIYSLASNLGPCISKCRGTAGALSNVKHIKGGEHCCHLISWAD
ncbi:hypothetical protein AVEN_18735-1 [Araneus ventricosus]|uniref:Uncharacterized protein n=1 Tax=Araneus ventricosus TaxID=182803 RepID=A0A4Y2GKT6_ARAVE|nr:hypothetical protein AVEN_18735-1 [Araneus ventricosus]